MAKLIVVVRALVVFLFVTFICLNNAVKPLSDDSKKKVSDGGERLTDGEKSDDANCASDSPLVSNTKRCGEDVFHFSSRTLTVLLRTMFFLMERTFVLLDLVSDVTTRVGTSNEKRRRHPKWFEAQYAVRAVKICARCDDFAVDDEGNDLGFEEYCGPSSYGHNETMTGTLLIPLDAKGRIKSGMLNTTVWSHGFHYPYSSVGDVLPRNVFSIVKEMLVTTFHLLTGYDKVRHKIFETVMRADSIGAVMLASRGVVTIIPHYMGHGHNRFIHKGTGVHRSYQTGIVPLFMYAQKYVRDYESNDSSTSGSWLSEHVFTAGFSEGGIATLAASQALHKLGYNVKAYSGGFPSDPVVEKMSLFYKTVMKGKNPYYAFLSAWTVAFHSSSPHVDIAPGEGFFTEAAEKEIQSYINSDRTQGEAYHFLKHGFNVTGPDCVERGLSCSRYANPMLVRSFLSVSGHDPLIDTDYLPCNRKNPAPELSTLCAALRTQDMGNLLLSSPYPVDLCASPDDDVVGHNTDFYQNIIRMKSNIKLEPSEDSWREQGGKKGIKYSHRKAGIICNFINVFKILNAIEK